MIVGIPRSGLLVGSIIALKLNLPIVTLEQFLNNSKVKTGKTRKTRKYIDRTHGARKVLLIDDSYNTGKSFKSALDELSQLDIPDLVIDKAVIYSSVKIPEFLDFYLEFVPQPRAFEWNLFHSSIVSKTLFDIDGVVCEDPSEQDNDDGVHYKSFLLNAPPLNIPTQRVLGFVTSRLEKYRSETEIWLNENKIQYDSLKMSTHKSARERQQAQDHGVKKGIVYRDSNAILFIESEYKQALQIVKVSGKCVYCTETNELYQPGCLDLITNKEGLKCYIKNKLKGIKFVRDIYFNFKRQK
nr:phosphoribosyltransferase family protein [Pseudoalteromonas sp. McH1-7]